MPKENKPVIGAYVPVMKDGRAILVGVPLPILPCLEGGVAERSLRKQGIPCESFSVAQLEDDPETFGMVFDQFVDLDRVFIGGHLRDLWALAFGEFWSNAKAP